MAIADSYRHEKGLHLAAPPSGLGDAPCTAVG